MTSRESLRRKTKVITIYAAAVSALVGSYVAIDRLDIDVPRPAMLSELYQVADYSYETRLILLYQQLRVAKIDAAMARANLQKNPGNRELIQSVVDEETKVEVLRMSIKKIKKYLWKSGEPPVRN